MGGRGSSSAGGAVSVRNAEMHRKYVDGKLSTRITKNDRFMMDTVLPGMNYYKKRSSKSSVYAHADRVSKDSSHICVMVSHDAVRATKYGYSLQLDRDHVVYVKNWQVYGHTVPYKGQTGVEVAMSKKYFKPKRVNRPNEAYSVDRKNLQWSEWVKAAKEQQRAGNIVSIRM